MKRMIATLLIGAALLFPAVVANAASTGGPGTDVIYGTAGDDVLTGGGGNDRIFSGRGVDIVHGGPGYDICWVQRVDSVTDCEALVGLVDEG